MPQYRWLVDNPHSFQFIPLTVNIPDTFDYVVDVALGINSSGYGEPYHLQRGRFEFAGLRFRFAEHHAADFTGADAAAKIELTGQRLTRVLMRRDMR